MLTQEVNIKVKLLKNIMTKNKTKLPSLRNQDWKKVKVGSNKVNKLIPNTSTSNITELNELIYAGAMFICDKISVPFRNPMRNTKPGWEIRFEGPVKKL